MHAQGYVGNEDFYVSPLKHADVLSRAPWFTCMLATLQYLDRVIAFKHKGRDITIQANDKGNTNIP